MNKEHAEAAIQKADRVRNMVNECPGWKDICEIIEVMRREAFSDWTTLPLNAAPEHVLNVRARELVMREFLDRVDSIMESGDEAKRRMESESEGNGPLYIPAETPAMSEIEHLLKPIRRWFPDFGRSDNRDKAAKAKGVTEAATK